MGEIKYRSESEMKDSEIEWIGDIPENWIYSKIKNFYSYFKGRNAQKLTKEYIASSKSVYPVYSGQTENDGIMGYVEEYEFDLNECLFTTTVGAKVMTPMMLKGKFNLSQNCLIMKKNHNNINDTFVYYWLYPLFRFEKSLIPSYMQPSLRMEDLNKYNIFIPSLFEQQKIANFLDIKTTELNQVISKKEKLIEKLEEAKKSLISEVVTGKVKIVDGELIPRDDSEMKDSGVDWIGMVPKEWEVSSIRRVFKIKKIPIYKEDNVVLSLTQQGLKIKELDDNKGQHASSYSGYQEVLINDFVMNHMDLLTGYVDCSKFIGVTSPDYRVFKFIDDNKMSHEYYLYFFQMCYKNKIFYGHGRGVSNLGRWRLQTEAFKYFPLLVGSEEEQLVISCFLKDKSRNINTSIDKNIEIIKVLKEAKQSLIYEAVTGKIDLRDWEIKEDGEVQ